METHRIQFVGERKFKQKHRRRRAVLFTTVPSSGCCGAAVDVRQQQKEILEHCSKSSSGQCRTSSPKTRRRRIVSELLAEQKGRTNTEVHERHRAVLSAGCGRRRRPAERKKYPKQKVHWQPSVTARLAPKTKTETSRIRIVARDKPFRRNTEDNRGV